MTESAEWPRARGAGIAALAAAGAWIAWAGVNARTHGALDGPRTGANAPWGWLGAALLAAWTVLVIPAALVLGRALRPLAPRVVPPATAAGVLSLATWAAAALGGWWPAWLEPGFLACSAAWWAGIGGPLRRAHPRLGALTLVLAAAALGDAIVTAAAARLPAWAFPVVGGAKLPLQVLWTASVGVVLWRRGAAHARREAAASAAA